MWCNHFRQLYNSVHTDSDKYAFYETVQIIDKQSPVRVTVADIRDAIAALKNTRHQAQMVFMLKHLNTLVLGCGRILACFIRSVCVIIMYQRILCLSILYRLLKINVAT